MTTAEPQPETWLFISPGAHLAAFNMAFDEALLEAAPRLGRPVLRFYNWLEPAASFGYSQKYTLVAPWTSLRPLIRRPTGGGLVPHESDWTYSLVFPPGHPWYALKAGESYCRVHDWQRAAFARLALPTELAPTARPEGPGQCFVGAEQHDLLWRGAKIAGAAQRRTRDGLLIQGSVQPPPVPLAQSDWQQAVRDVAREAWKVGWSPFEPDAKLSERVDELVREKYSLMSYNQRR